MLNFVIKGKPITKKNSMRLVNCHGRMIPIPSKAYKEFEANAKKYLEYWGTPICKPVCVKCTFFYPLKKDGEIPKILPDLTNLLEAIDDILVKYEILADDNCSIIVSHDGSRVIWTSEEPMTRIEILEE